MGADGLVNDVPMPSEIQYVKAIKAESRRNIDRKLYERAAGAAEEDGEDDAPALAAL